MAKKSENKKYIKNILVKGKVKNVEMTEEEVKEFLLHTPEIDAE